MEPAKNSGCVFVGTSKRGLIIVCQGGVVSYPDEPALFCLALRKPPEIRNCPDSHLPAAGQVSLLLLLLDEGVCAIILEDDRLADVGDLTALV